jgi:hypothetical protein
MTFARTTISLLVLATLATAAHAESPNTREQVKAELREAIRTGDVLATGEGAVRLNEETPQRYARQRTLLAVEARAAAAAASAASR